MKRYRYSEAAGRSPSRKNEKAILAGVFVKGRKIRTPHVPSTLLPEDLMSELDKLARSAGAIVADMDLISVSRYTPATLLGKGKAEYLHEKVHRHDADMVIVYNLLRPGQQKNLENILGVKVVDRKELILDIFSQRARSAEGKLQVELAQLEFRLSRIIGKGLELSRTGGGIGTRGPGEKKLEVDRRRIRERISQITKELAKVRKTRQLHRRSRKKKGMPVVSLVGYTNAGKSSIFNVLTGSSVDSRDQMFSTLDPTTRKLAGNENDRKCLLVDTVGFIRDLPPELFESFKATLEGISASDLIIHLIDISSPFSEENRRVVESVLIDIGTGTIPVLTVFNKVDLLKREGKTKNKEGELYISAKSGEGCKELRREIENLLKGSGSTGRGSIQNVY